MTDNKNPASFFKATPSSLAALMLLLIVSLLCSGCSITSLKQREATVTNQEQELASNQKLMEKEKSRLNKLKAELEQEKKRLAVLKKSPTAGNAAGSSKTGHLADNTSVIIGELEYVYLSPPNIQLSARIDTGANTSSLNALDLTEIERDGKPYVRFSLIDPQSGEKVELTRRVKGRVKIKEHLGEALSRPIVKMRVRLGNLDQHIEMTLADRSEFKNQVLIGRNFLRDFAIVDVSKKYLSKPVIEEE